MSNEKWFYDQVTRKYFKDTREHIDHVLSEVNAMLEADCTITAEQAMAQIYAKLGIMNYDAALRAFGTYVPFWEWTIYEVDEIKYDDLMISEVAKRPETKNDISKENEMNETRTDFEVFNVTINSDENSVILRFRRDGEDISFALSEGNIDTLRRWLKIAKKIIH